LVLPLESILKTLDSLPEANHLEQATVRQGRATQIPNTHTERKKERKKERETRLPFERRPIVKGFVKLHAEHFDLSKG
jgi:hypothetical protein